MQSSFWSALGMRFAQDGGFKNSTNALHTIDALLDTQPTLEQVLDHDDVINECKFMNTRLIEFLATKQCIEQLIRYVIKTPPEEEPAVCKGDLIHENQRNYDQSDHPASIGSGSLTSSSGSSVSLDECRHPASIDVSSGGPEDVNCVQLVGDIELKYPFVASELFACESAAMLDELFQHQELLDLLFSFLDRKAPLDPSSVGYFRKVVVVLVQRKYKQLIAFITGRGIVDKLVEHIGLYSIMELLIMIGWDDGLGQVQDTEWLYQENLVPKLVAKLDPKFELVPDVHMNAARTLVDVVVKCPPSTKNLLVLHLQKTEILQQIFNHMFSTSMSSLTNAMSIIIVLVQRYANSRIFPDSGIVDDGGGSQIDQFQQPNPDSDLVSSESWPEQPEERSSLHMKHELQGQSNFENYEMQRHRASFQSEAEASANEEPFFSLVEHLDKLLSLLQPNNKLMSTQFGIAMPFGETRMKVVELCLVLFRSHVPVVDQLLIKYRVLNTLLDAFFDYPWNNMLHGLVESIIRTVLEGDSFSLQRALFDDVLLIERFIDAFNKNESIVTTDYKSMPSHRALADAGGVNRFGASSSQYYRQGYMGHVIRTCTAIEEIYRLDEALGKHLLADKEQSWTEFLSNKLEKELDRQKVREFSGGTGGVNDIIDGLPFDMANMAAATSFMQDDGNDSNPYQFVDSDNGHEYDEQGWNYCDHTQQSWPDPDSDDQNGVAQGDMLVAYSSAHDWQNMISSDVADSGSSPTLHDSHNFHATVSADFKSPVVPRISPSGAARTLLPFHQHASDVDDESELVVTGAHMLDDFDADFPPLDSASTTRSDDLQVSSHPENSDTNHSSSQANDFESDFEPDFGELPPPPQ